MTFPHSSTGLEELVRAGLWQPGQPLKLHLGCGEQYLPGYVNIDYPPSEHNVMRVRVDLFSDVTRLEVSSGLSRRDPIAPRSSSRVVALAQLIRWTRFLKVDGQLWIETPDVLDSARIVGRGRLGQGAHGVVRHLAGDQAAPWAFHVDHWYPQRFERTLGAMGYAPVQISTSRWPQEPFLSNVHAVATKSVDLPLERLQAAAEELLTDSMVAPSEEETYAVWKRQLREALAGGAALTPGVATARRPIRHDASALGRAGSLRPLARRSGLQPAGSRCLDRTEGPAGAGGVNGPRRRCRYVPIPIAIRAL